MNLIMNCWLDNNRCTQKAWGRGTGDYYFYQIGLKDTGNRPFSCKLFQVGEKPQRVKPIVGYIIIYVLSHLMGSGLNSLIPDTIQAISLQKTLFKAPNDHFTLVSSRQKCWLSFQCSWGWNLGMRLHEGATVLIVSMVPLDSIPMQVCTHWTLSLPLPGASGWWGVLWMALELWRSPLH